MKNSRLFWLLAMVLLAIIPVPARIVSDFFFSAPDSVMLLIPTNRRYDMIDYFRYGSETPIKNILEGESRILSESDTVIDLQVSEHVSMQYVMLTAEEDTVMAVITTLELPVKDSSIAFYDKSWQKLKKQPVAAPDYDDWLTKEGRKNRQYIVDILPFVLASANFDMVGGTLTFKNNTIEYLVPEEYDKVKQWLVPMITYDVLGTKIKLRK